MQKQFTNFWPEGSMEYVVMHGKWQRSRGRNPSAPYLGEHNPREALAQASADLALTDTTVDTLVEEVQRDPMHRGLDRELFRAAVGYRIADRAQTVALARRNHQIHLAAEEGKTRRAISEIIGKSPARIQQILDSKAA